MKLYFLSFFVLCLVLVTHILGMNGMYYLFPPYDIFMHMLGGIGIGLAICAAVQLHGNKIVHKRTVIILGVFVVGLVWELFEIYFDITGSPLWSTPYYIDTVKDFIDDMIGGAIVAFSYFKNK